MRIWNLFMLQAYLRKIFHLRLGAIIYTLLANKVCFPSNVGTASSFGLSLRTIPNVSPDEAKPLMGKWLVAFESGKREQKFRRRAHLAHRPCHAWAPAAQLHQARRKGLPDKRRTNAGSHSAEGGSPQARVKGRKRRNHLGRAGKRHEETQPTEATSHRPDPQVAELFARE